MAIAGIVIGVILAIFCGYQLNEYESQSLINAALGYADDETMKVLIIAGLCVGIVLAAICLFVLPVLGRKAAASDQTVDVPGTGHSESLKAGDSVSRLRELAQMKEEGLLTEEEYQQKKSDILKEM